MSVAGPGKTSCGCVADGDDNSHGSGVDRDEMRCGGVADRDETSYGSGKIETKRVVAVSQIEIKRVCGNVADRDQRVVRSTRKMQ